MMNNILNDFTLYKVLISSLYIYEPPICSNALKWLFYYFPFIPKHTKKQMFDFFIDKQEQMFYTDNQGKQQKARRPTDHTSGVGAPLIRQVFSYIHTNSAEKA